MKALKLIELLQEYDPDAEVTVFADGTSFTALGWIEGVEENPGNKIEIRCIG
jgi:hypothetical protein